MRRLARPLQTPLQLRNAPLQHPRALHQHPVLGHQLIDPQHQLDRQRRLITNEKLRSGAIHNEPFAATPPGPFSLTNNISRGNRTSSTPEPELLPDPLNAYADTVSRVVR